MKRPTIVPGHQVVGRIAALGSDLSADSVRVGQRVGISWVGGADGTCEACRHGLENLCDNIVFTGYSVNGGYSQFPTATLIFAFRCHPSLRQKDWRHCYAPGSSAFEPCELRESSAASGSVSTDSELPRTSPSKC